MRDVDLFAGVTSIANDPNCATLGRICTSLARPASVSDARPVPVTDSGELEPGESPQ
ncbi:MAG: hypothetical protein ACRDPJ_21485 [Nocardioidaceae bacterium]